jgi:hypothetical protein
MKRMTFIALALAATLGMVASAKAAQVVGNTVAVNPDAEGTPPGSKPRTLVLGTGLVFNERIDTSGNGLVQVLLVDGTSMIVGPGSSITINKFVYDPDKGDGSLAITMGEGTMRFIGGALSKKKGAQVTTPVGTLAIRGAIADLVTDKDSGKFSLVFGKELSFTGSNGETSRIHEQNYTMEVGTDGAGSVHIRRTEKSDTLAIQQALAGKSGQHGGASGGGVPTDTKVDNSNFAEVNSGQPPAQDGSTQVAQTVESQPPQDVGNEVTQNATSDGIRNDVEEQEAFCTTLCINFRIFTAPVPTFNVSFGPIVSDPGSQGLIGGTSDPNADTRASAVQIDADTIRVTRDGQSIDVPFNTTPGLHDIPSFTDFNGNTQAGTLYVGADAQFFFYALFENGDIDAPTYAFGGTPTPVAALEGGDRLITYTILPDPRQNIDIPLTLASLVPDTTGASISPFYLMAPDSGKIGGEGNPNGPGHGLQATLMIQGQGPDQTSEATLIVGGFFDDNGATDFGTGSRGSLRVDPTQGALINGGGVGFIKGPERSVFYGPDANNAVLSSTLSQDDALGYSEYRGDYDFQTELLFSTMHVLEQTGSQPQSELTRETHSLSGYASGMVESDRLYNGDGITSVAYRSTSSNLEVNFDATNDTMGASFTVNDVQNADPQFASFHLSFGFDPVTGGYGRGAYVDDDRYGATGSNNPDGNTIVTDASDVITIENDTPDDNFMYFFGNDLAPQTEFFSDGHQPCVCKFLEWGYWGGKRQYFDADAGVTREEFYHLGTWVAGDISNEADLPTDGTATYSGHAVGDVTRNIDGVDNQYVAGGGFDMTWDFGSRTGTATISDFDGITASAPVTDTSIANAANSFAGSFSGTDSIGGNSVTGGLNGSFVAGPDGPEQGVIGSFDFAGPGVSATGIVAAERPLH